MPNITILDNRYVTPRWRNFGDTVVTGEISPKFEPYEIDYSDFELKVGKWKREPSIVNAVELINSAISFRQEKSVIEAANQILKDESVSPVLKELTASFINPQEGTIEGLELGKINETVNQNLRKLKKSINMYIDNPIDWIQLARWQFINGNKEKAERAIKIALNLGHPNRFILRSASSFYIHQGDYDKASYLLRKSEQFKHDPWLLAAEISTASLMNRSSRYLKLAESIINSRKFDNFNLTELASSLGTEEFNHGKLKVSRRLINLSLQSPNENSLAQAEWMCNKGSSIRIPDDLFRIPLVHEANAYRNYWLEKWEETYSNSKLWFLDQPFSKETVIFSSYIAASVLNQYDESIEFCKFGLRIHPQNFLIQNNLTFAKLMKGDFENIERNIYLINQLASTKREKVTLSATNGLYYYRTGNNEMGEKFYVESIDMAKKLGDKELIALATLNYLREKFLATKDVTIIEKAKNIFPALKLDYHGLIHKVQSNVLDAMIGKKP